MERFSLQGTLGTVLGASQGPPGTSADGGNLPGTPPCNREIHLSPGSSRNKVESRPKGRSQETVRMLFGLRPYYAVKKVFVKFFAKFFKVFQSFRKFFEVFASFSRLSDRFGPIGMHSDAFGSNWKCLDVFDFF